MRSETLEQLLSRERAAGELHSTAEFTIDSLKARQKLGQYQLPEAGLWLVKVVQAAVACGAASVDIKFRNRLVEVGFTSPDVLDAESLLRVVVSGKLPKDRTLFHLVAGLRAGATETTESLEWTTTGPEGTTGVRFTEEQVELFRTDESSPEVAFRVRAGRPFRLRGLSRTLASPVSHLVRMTVEEHRCVTSRCWCSPIPINLDGRPLNPCFPHPAMVPTEGRVGEVLSKYWNHYQNAAALVHLAVRALPPVEGRPLLPTPGFVQANRFHRREGSLVLNRPVCKDGVFALWSPPEHGVAGGVLCLSAGLGMESRLHFILDGAVVDSYPLAWESKVKSLSPLVSITSAVRIFCAVRPDELDLSHFQVRGKEALATDLARKWHPTAFDTAAECCNHINHFHYVPIGGSAWKVGAAWAGVAAAVAGFVLSPAAPLFVVGGNAALLPVNFAIYRSFIKPSIENLRDFLTPREKPADVFPQKP